MKDLFSASVVAFILPATACESRDLGVLGYRASALSAAAAASIIAVRALAARERSLRALY